MLLSAQRELDVDLQQSFVIGDRYLDVHMAHRVGARGVLVLTGDGRSELENRKQEPEQPDLVSENLLTAVDEILSLT
jgi:D-glycero-D-manno-heptose 1,7-bisphosphate phosphatase